MLEDKIFSHIQGTGVVAIVTLSDAAAAGPLADALVSGGVTSVEVTLRSEAAFDAIEAIAGRQDICVGVGTVTTAVQVNEALARGAKFVVSPGFSAEVVSRSLELEAWVIPGVATATEVQSAMTFGLQRLKLFPAEIVGGLGFLDALFGPFPDIEFMPSGGVSLQNVGGYLARPNVFAAGCSWIAPRAMISSHSFERIAAAARTAVAAAAVRP